MQPSGTRLVGARPVRVLVIDDEPLLCQVIRRVLETEFHVTVVHDARDALGLARPGEGFDLILCDLMMPEMSGIEYFRALREERAEDARRIVFMTGGVHTPEGRAFFAASSNRWVEKPMDATTLLRVVREVVDDASAAQRAASR